MRGKKRKDLSKDQILLAQKNTRSNRSAARYLNVSYTHYKRWAKLYKDLESNIDLFEKHKNPGGKGVPKFMGGKGGKIDKFPILDIINGKISSDHFTPDKIKDSMIREGLIREQCCECGFSERRVSDYRMPLLLYFVDNNKRNYKVENIKLICYNCYFMLIDDVFNSKQKLAIQDHRSINSSDFDWDLDQNQSEKLKELIEEKNSIPRSKDDGMEFVSRL